MIRITITANTEAEAEALKNKLTFPANITVCSGTGEVSSICDDESSFWWLVRRAIAFGGPTARLPKCQRPLPIHKDS